MANATPSRLGFINNTSDGSFAQDNALFLKVFGGEVMTAFQETNIMEPLHMVRTIPNGKSATFPRIGKTTAAYHTPGAEITGSSVKHNEVIINIDGKLLTSVFISDIDEAKNYYDVRAPYSRAMGRSLALEYDKNILQLMCLAARTSTIITGENGGTQITNANFGTSGVDLATGLFTAAQKLDEKDVMDARHAVFRPAQYFLLVQNTNTIDNRWGGSGSYSDGKVNFVADIQIHKSNNLPSSNIAAKTGENNTYSGDFSNTQGVVFTTDAVGTVKLMDLSVEDAWDIRRQGTLMVANYAMGHGVLRPECAVEFITA